MNTSDLPVSDDTIAALVAQAEQFLVDGDDATFVHAAETRFQAAMSLDLIAGIVETTGRSGGALVQANQMLKVFHMMDQPDGVWLGATTAINILGV